MTSPVEPCAAPSEPKEVLSPELVLVDPELARRWREQEVARALMAVDVIPPTVSNRASVTTSVRTPLGVAESKTASLVRHMSTTPASAPAGQPSTGAIGLAGAAASIAGRRLPPRRQRQLILSLVATFVVLCLGSRMGSPNAGEAFAAAASHPASHGADVNGGTPLVAPPQTGVAPRVGGESTGSGLAAPSSASNPTRAAVPNKSQRHAASKATASVRPIRLAWVPAAGAVAYSLELFQGSHRILAARTTRPTFTLQPRWRYEGAVKRLTPGTYRWYVWSIDRAGVRAASASVRSTVRVGRS